MIDYQSIRARYELAVRAALAPERVILHYDNVEEEPIPGSSALTEYAVITVSFPSSTEPDICGGVVSVRGNVQVNIAGPRGAGLRLGRCDHLYRDCATGGSTGAGIGCDGTRAQCTDRWFWFDRPDR